MFNTVLVPLDGNPLAEGALGVAIAIARDSQAELHLVFAGEIAVGGPISEAVDHLGYLARIAHEIALGTGLRIKASMWGGIPADVICDRVRAEKADLVVLVSHGRTGFSRAWRGSVADAVVRGSAVPVLMLREPAPAVPSTAGMVSRILVPLDGSDTSSAILEPAAALARCAGASIALVRVVRPASGPEDPSSLIDLYPLETSEADPTRIVADDAERQLADASSRLMELGVTDVTIDVRIATGITAAILAVAVNRRADLIAMSTHGRGASRLFVGSVADKLIRGSALPMLIYRPSQAEQSDATSRATEKPVSIFGLI